MELKAICSFNAIFIRTPVTLSIIRKIYLNILVEFQGTQNSETNLEKEE